MKFRNDITGLRAIAVLPVLFFHAGHPWFTGGFLGVDVFFAISGFLITTLIYAKTENREFSFLSFYDRRARRILPAFLVVLVVSCIAAPFFMVPYDIKNFGQSLVASSLSANNLLLYMTSGYWSLAAEFKPLYHTWSLAVEEQYYLVAPILIVIFFGLFRSKKSILLPLISVLIISFTASAISEDKEFNFLLIFTRAWELAAGAILALAMYKKNNIRSSNFWSAVGLSLILLSYSFPYSLSNNQAFVNLPAIVGTLLIIYFSNDTSTWIGRFLSSKILVGIGLISYSIYLWHQPILAYLRLASEQQPETSAQILFSLISIPLAYLSWKFVENPARDKNTISNKLFYSSIFIGFSSMVLLGISMHKTYGFQHLWPQYAYGGNPQSYIDSARKYKTESFQNLSSGKPKVLIIGNSFARDFIKMLQENSVSNKLNLAYFEGNCRVGNKATLKSLLTDSDYVIYAQNWGNSGYFKTDLDELIRCSSYLHKNTIKAKVFVLGSKNFGWNNNFVKTHEYNQIINYRVHPLESVLQFNSDAKSRVSDYIDVMKTISENGKVRIFDGNGKFLTYDTNHLTKFGARYIGSILLKDTPLSILNATTHTLVDKTLESSISH